MSLYFDTKPYEMYLKRHLLLLAAMAVSYAACLIVLAIKGFHWAFLVLGLIIMIHGILDKMQDIFRARSGYRETLHDQKRYLYRETLEIEKERKKGAQS